MEIGTTKPCHATPPRIRKGRRLNEERDEAQFRAIPSNSEQFVGSWTGILSKLFIGLGGVGRRRPDRRWTDGGWKSTNVRLDSTYIYIFRLWNRRSPYCQCLSPSDPPVVLSFLSLYAARDPSHPIKTRSQRPTNHQLPSNPHHDSLRSVR